MDLSWSLKDKDLTSKGSGDKKEISGIALGILTDPPTLVFVYEVEESGKKKRRKRKIPLRSFSDRSNVSRTIFGLQTRHSEYLSKVPNVTLEKMIRIIQEVQKGLEVDEAVVKVNQEYEISPDQDLNKLSSGELAKKKEIMDETFLKNLVKPTDPDYVYDKEVDFSKKAMTAIRENTWDESDGDEGENTNETKLDNCTNQQRISSESEDNNGVVERVDSSKGDDVVISLHDTKPSENPSLISSSPIIEKKNSVVTKPPTSIYDDFEDDIDDADFW